MLRPPFKVTATVSWPGEEPGDLGFMEDEIIDVLEFIDASWWSGKLVRNKAEGIFPMEYVKVVPGSVPESPRSLNGRSTITPAATSHPMISHQSLPASSPAANTTYATSDSPFGPRSHSSPVPHSTVEYHQSLLREKELEIERLKSQYARYEKGSPAKGKPQILPIDNETPARFQQPSALTHPLASKNFPKIPKTPQKNRRTASEPYSPNTQRPELSANHASSPSNLGAPKSLTHDNIEKSHTPEDIALARKRAQLELELIKLVQLEQSISKKLSSSSQYDISHSSTKESNGLDRKLSDSLSISDDDDEPPPPPPKRGKPRNTTLDRVEQPNPNMGKLPVHPQYKSLNEYASPRLPFDSADFRISENSVGGTQLTKEDLLRLSQMQPEQLRASIQSLQSDVLNLSELSATSAGSFMRHKQGAESFLASMSGSGHPNFGVSESVKEPPVSRAVLHQVFEDKKSRQSIFKKILSKRNGDDTNMLERKLQEFEREDWAEIKAGLHRMNSLVTLDKQARTRRVLRHEGTLIVKPWSYVTDVNVNETLDDNDIPEARLELNPAILSKIDHFMSKYDSASDLNVVIADINAKFHSSRMCQVRCVLVHLSKFDVIEESDQILTVKPKLLEVTQQGKVTIFQLNYLFKKMLDAFQIQSEVVVGFWKKPNEFYHNEEYVVNHCWLAILIEHTFVITDIYCFKNGATFNIRDHSRGYNEFYAGAEPLLLVSTHIPSVIDLQHIIPPIDHNVAFHLPRAYLGFYRNRLQFVNHNNALSRLKDMEIFELELEVPIDVELFTLVKTSKATTNELSLCQIKWVRGVRTAKVKAILPQLESIGVLQIFAGPKGLQKHFDNVHELAVVIPLYHEGDCKPGKFVSRFPTVQSQNHDLYIQQPQTCQLVRQNAYNFEVLQHPSQGLLPASEGMPPTNLKLVIESPSGKYFKLVNVDALKPYGTYECNIKCNDVGLYRGLVIGDSGASWYVFAQWECVAASEK